LAASLASGSSLEDSVTLANHAAGVVVGKLGTATVSVSELVQAHHAELNMNSSVVSEEWLAKSVSLLRQRGEKVVMTNGCFDILHAGHVQYLQRARELGDYLVVAVNSDESVRQLKGETRPVNDVDQRMTLLAALACVDWVVTFSEETPKRLYANVLPNVIVKGGDYTPEQVVGGDSVIEKGGEVVIIDFLDGVSTSNIIKKIKG
jgi:D-beta-D-heptose 7-phosphate kinase/D-beta-D-heptose 1-phosphate adenosyltransferase